MAEQEKKNFFDEILSFPANLAKGVGDVKAAFEFGGREFSPSHQKKANDEVNQLLSAYRAIDPEQTEQRNEMLQRIRQTPTFQKHQAEIGASIQGQADRDKSIKRAGSLTRLLSSGEDVFTDAQKAGVRSSLNTTLADGGFLDDQATGGEAGSTNPNTRQRASMASIFSEGLSAAGKAAPGSRLDAKETQAFSDKIMQQAAAEGVAPSAASSFFSEKFNEESGKEGTFRNDVLPSKSTAETFFPQAQQQGPPQTKGDAEITNFENSVQRDTEALNKKKATKAQPFESFTQVATEDFPIDNTPVPMAGLGIETPADQQTMQEIVKAAPQGMDIQEVAKQDPDAFKQVLSALRKGKTPSGKPFTMKDALEMMGQL